MAQRQQETTKLAGPIGVEALTQTSKAAIVSGLAAPQQMAELTSEAMAEWMAFVSRRAKAQAELFGQLSHCHNAGSAAEAQRKFVSHCAQDYADEFAALIELGCRNTERMLSVLPVGGKTSDTTNGSRP